MKLNLENFLPLLEEWLRVVQAPVFAMTSEVITG